MPVLNRQFLEDLGIRLSDKDYTALAQHFDETLHERVIEEVVLELDPKKAEELASLKDADEATVQQWLLENVSDLEEIVSDEVDILLGEIAESSEKLNISSNG